MLGTGPRGPVWADVDKGRSTTTTVTTVTKPHLQEKWDLVPVATSAYVGEASRGRDQTRGLIIAIVVMGVLIGVAIGLLMF